MGEELGREAAALVNFEQNLVCVSLSGSSAQAFSEVLRSEKGTLEAYYAFGLVQALRELPIVGYTRLLLRRITEVTDISGVIPRKAFVSDTAVSKELCRLTAACTAVANALTRGSEELRLEAQGIVNEHLFKALASKNKLVPGYLDFRDLAAYSMTYVEIPASDPNSRLAPQPAMLVELLPVESTRAPRRSR